mmetsp:Transcript_348/g.637  ORF Transcript_348/g.637 Transcript_348/m.637 type:complete len:96 (-) Transcript_348:232-519(-)|eukprot:CAMPEP_0170167848 /NCGR_PEP_ID=MMETSP0040_2-20121228/1129_1 /TAXON_ID=641309 /ORGANISM="Lotharella oceanica, Strain CCMP622" /LENGTH=95 /DNA_ID=CAMNT_0010405989 /DNA_START=27 /DNA_END=314 /DNA_ORIENTATION=+
MRRRATDEDVETSKMMFYGGFAFLPWLWLINFVQYRPYVKEDDTPEDMKYYVRGSMYGFLIFMALWGVWLAIFYANLESPWAQGLLLFEKGDTMF